MLECFNDVNRSVSDMSSLSYFEKNQENITLFYTY